MQKFITFGETMVQYNAEYTGAFDPEKKYFPDVAGAESNVAINLSKITKNHDSYLPKSRKSHCKLLALCTLVFSTF